MADLSVRSEALGADGVRLRFADGGDVLAWRDVLARWESDDAFCDLFSRSLADMPYPGFFWETPPLTQASAGLPFECAAISAPGLARPASAQAFAAQLAKGAEGPMVAFGNLGGDADLVVPRRIDASADYAHLGAFLRTAPAAQVREAWRCVAATAGKWLAEERTCWVSTAGFGVPWLHLRIDARPKYYSHAPYRTTAWSGAWSG